MADSSVGVQQPPSPDRPIDAVTVTTGAGAVWRQVVESVDRTATGGASLANVTNAVASSTLCAANTARRGLLVVNDSASATLYLKYGATASATSFSVSIPPGGNWSMPAPIYTGIVDCIASAAVGTARVTELT